MTKYVKKAKAFAVEPFVQFLKQESSSSIIMLLAMTSAMILANSAYSGWYHDLWHMEVGIAFGGFSLHKSLIHWINDGLMAIFFLVIGLEIKREILIGELSSFRKALLPMIAALGGAVVPALIYAGLNMNGGIMSGWGVPMATDIAFAIGIMALLGSRVPIQLKIFITSLAVVDDMIAVIVIALFYTHEIIYTYLLYAGIAVALLAVLNFTKVKSILVYLAVGIFLWYFLLKSGVHATIAGVILAFFIPSEPRIPLQTYSRTMNTFLKELNDSKNNPDSEIPTKDQKKMFNKIIHASLSVYNPMSRLEYNLHGISAYFIMPLFAFANTGVTISSEAFSSLASPVSLGVIFGLLIGKPLGILASVKIGEKLKMITMPEEISGKLLFGAAVLSGIGLTMSIFISGMAFSAAYADVSKIAILTASVIAGISGYTILRIASK